MLLMAWVNRIWHSSTAYYLERIYRPTRRHYKAVHLYLISYVREREVRRESAWKWEQSQAGLNRGIGVSRSSAKIWNINPLSNSLLYIN